MATLQERLRENADFVGREDTRKTVTEAADALDALVEALTEVDEWIANWSPNFEQDDEWPATKAKIRAALARVKQ